MEYIGATGLPVTFDAVPIEDGIDFWISNAFLSLKSIVETYHLDGVDIHYESFRRHNESFAYCIGELITPHKNQSVIDYVNYQFYTDKVKNPRDKMERFRLRAMQFDADKLLPSYKMNGRGIQGDAFFDALSLEEENGFEVYGVMIFSADASSSNDYYYERKSQAFLLNSTRSMGCEVFSNY
ncbi:hypothetical protein SLEP1_g52435 [Rubroshorea leprosula]|uniref:GH18 domain-containing protein n=1 Tax=Rubroshorea leprosula TaxID=152421 RepID=A0AAV5M7B0_9ROSI|nr:hypothetical protein SLEP1_g52435 [Rubroshorea leprosula]